MGFSLHFHGNVSGSVITMYKTREKFGAKIIAKFPNIKFLTAKLSEKALKWVS